MAKQTRPSGYYDDDTEMPPAGRLDAIVHIVLVVFIFAVVTALLYSGYWFVNYVREYGRAENLFMHECVVLKDQPAQRCHELWRWRR